MNDWHPADIRAALEKRGLSISELARRNGYRAQTSIGAALRRPLPVAEAIIAAALDLSPCEIWPSRYQVDGKPVDRRKPYGRGMPRGKVA